MATGLPVLPAVVPVMSASTCLPSSSALTVPSTFRVPPVQAGVLLPVVCRRLVLAGAAVIWLRICATWATLRPVPVLFVLAAAAGVVFAVRVVVFFWAAVLAASFALICSRIWRTCSTLRLMLLLLYHPIVCDT